MAGISEIQQPIAVRRVGVGRAQGGRDRTEDPTGLSVVQYVMARYSFAEHGGAVGIIGTGIIVPADAVLFQRLFVNVEPLISAGEPVVKFTLDDADNDTLSSNRFNGSNYSYGAPPSGPFQNSEGDREIKVVIQDAAITGGVDDCYAFYVLPIVG